MRVKRRLKSWVGGMHTVFGYWGIEAELSNRKVDVVEEGIDILFQITRATDTRLQSYDLINTTKTLMASPAYLEKFGTPVNPKDLQQHKGIRLKSAHIDASWTLFDGQAWVTYEPEARLTVNNVTLAREAAIEGLGIATVPDLIARQALDDKQLIPILEDFPMAQTKVTICFPQRAYLPRKYRVFIDFIYQSLSENTDYVLLDIPDFVTLADKPEQ